VLVARREDRLRALATQIGTAHPLLREIMIIPADLTQENDRLEVLAKVGGKVDILINNAGIGDYGELVSADWEKLRAMIDLNVTALVHLTQSILPSMKIRGRGGIINVSSLASELPIPDFALYAATKACVSRFSEGLRLEVKEHGIRVVAICPGPVHTEFGQRARRSDKPKSNFPLYGGFYTSPRRVVMESLRALERNSPLWYPGWRIRLLAHVLRLLPRWLVRLFLSQRWRRG
jgi:uncharacterized protein